MAWEDLHEDLTEMFGFRPVDPLTLAMAHVDVNVRKSKEGPRLWKRKPYTSVKRTKRAQPEPTPRSRDVVPCRQCSRPSHPGHKRCWKCLRRDAQIAKRQREKRRLSSVCAGCKVPSTRYRCEGCRKIEAEKARRRKAL